MIGKLRDGTMTDTSLSEEIAEQVKALKMKTMVLHTFDISNPANSTRKH